jgi:ketosteroid isomerase-like protein
MRTHEHKTSDDRSKNKADEQTPRTRALIEQFVDAWFARDADRLVPLLSEDAVWNPPASISGPVADRNRIAQALAGGAAGQYVRLDTLSRTVRRMVVEGPNATVLVHLEAETLTGEHYVNEYTWCFGCEDNMVKEIIEYADTLLAARLGFVPFTVDEEDGA